MKVITKTPILVFQDLEGSSLWLGVALVPDPVTERPRRIWGLVDEDGTHLTQMSYEARTTNPLAGDRPDKWVFHAGINLWTWTKDVQMAALRLGLGTPETYMGVDVPPELWPNWDRPETHWWRQGVKAALTAHLENLRTAAIHNLDESTMGLVRDLTTNLTQEVKAEGPRP
ncbi:hypothetical protein [Nonomuraea sp. NPDC050786]|uniref:hypothetical protein n=1 Tax=Nonomuraea sp. NPDC050786 TaxID=3154840 RepID=UPI0033F82D6B